LELNDDKVDELLNIVQKAFQRFFANSIVLLWAKLGGETVAKGDLTTNFGESGDCDF
jgi:hypothetical protein